MFLSEILLVRLMRGITLIPNKDKWGVPRYSSLMQRTFIYVFYNAIKMCYLALARNLYMTLCRNIHQLFMIVKHITLQ
jgi:hypothetical protein